MHCSHQKIILKNSLRSLTERSMKSVHGKFIFCFIWGKENQFVCYIIRFLSIISSKQWFLLLFFFVLCTLICKHFGVCTQYIYLLQCMYCVISRAITPVPVACCSFKNFSFSLSHASTKKSPRIIYVIVMGSHFFSFPLNQCFFKLGNFRIWEFKLLEFPSQLGILGIYAHTS